MEKTIEVTRRSVLPIYFAGFVWVLGGIFLELYRFGAFAACAAASAVVYLVARRLCPDVTTLQTVNFLTGREDADEMLTFISGARNQLKSLNDRIPDDALSAEILRMEQACATILQQLEQHPDDAPHLRRFVNHYLPDAIKILSLYAELDEKDVKGTHTTNVQQEVQQNAAMIATAFEAQADSLFASQALDISTDMQVLKGMLKGQGLA